jgi:hypothetical protein
MAWQAFTETGVWLPIQAQVTLDTTGRMLLGTMPSHDHPRGLPIE